MPSKAVTTKRYRRAHGCATCTHESGRYCQRLLMPISPEYICDLYEESDEKTPTAVACKDCKYGPKGDHSCETGGKKKPNDFACFAGKELKR